MHNLYMFFVNFCNNYILHLFISSSQVMKIYLQNGTESYFNTKKKRTIECRFLVVRQYFVHKLYFWRWWLKICIFIKNEKNFSIRLFILFLYFFYDKGGNIFYVQITFSSHPYFYHFQSNSIKLERWLHLHWTPI